MRNILLLSTVVALGLLSLITLSSIASQLAPKQAVFFVLGVATFLTFSKIPFKQLTAGGFLWYGLLCFLLLITLVLGENTRGSARWISVGGLFVIQASQLAAPVVSMLLASLLTSDKQKTLTLKKILQAVILIGIPAVLIMLEPDLGTTIAYAVSVLSIVFFSPIKTKYILWSMVIGVVGAIFAWNFLLHDYQKLRVESFISRHDTSGASYNAQQALIAVGSGQIWGRGLGQGVQSHLRFLPERQTDFVFASFAEEFGFLGGVVLLTIYGLLVTEILRVALETSSRAGKLFALGTLVMLVFQIFVNIGMNIGLLPITGITLPLMSNGGSSILSLCATLGIIESIKKMRSADSAIHIS